MSDKPTLPPDLADYATRYADQGYVVVKGLLSREEADFYREETHRLLASLGERGDPTWGSPRSPKEASSRWVSSR